MGPPADTSLWAVFVSETHQIMLPVVEDSIRSWNNHKGTKKDLFPRNRQGSSALEDQS